MGRSQDGRVNPEPGRESEKRGEKGSEKGPKPEKNKTPPRTVYTCPRELDLCARAWGPILSYDQWQWTRPCVYRLYHTEPQCETLRLCQQ